MISDDKIDVLDGTGGKFQPAVNHVGLIGTFLSVSVKMNCTLRRYRFAGGFADIVQQDGPFEVCRLIVIEVRPQIGPNVGQAGFQVIEKDFKLPIRVQRVLPNVELMIVVLNAPFEVLQFRDDLPKQAVCCQLFDVDMGVGGCEELDQFSLNSFCG